MGLFSRKPKSIVVQAPGVRAASDNDAMDRLEQVLPMVDTLPRLTQPPTLNQPAQTSRPGKATKPDKKGSIDPADFLALRDELVAMKARLDESEQARAIVEARLSSLDAAASTFTTERNDITEVANMVMRLQQQVAERAGDYGNAPSLAEGAVQDHAPKIAEFEAQIAQLRSDLETKTAGAAALPPPPTTSGPDPETLDRIAAVQQRVNDLDQIRHRLGDIDRFQQRIAEIDSLHQRVAGVEAMHERIGELDNDDIRLQLHEIGERLRTNEDLHAQVNQLLERAGASDSEARAVRDHMALLDQRLTNVSTELANQLSELGRDIDGLGQRVPEAGGAVVNDEVVDELRGGQVKLANEQARYEIAFREDLAALAEQVSRSRKGSER